MEETYLSIPPSVVLKYVGRSPERWKSLVGSTFEHNSLGKGTIRDVSVNDGGIILLVAFDQPPGSPPRKFGPPMLEKCSQLSLPAEAARQIMRTTAQFPKPLPSRQPGKFASQAESQEMRNPKDIMPGSDKPDPPQPLFHVGQEVVLRTDALRRGLVRKPPFFSEGQWQYEVFFSAEDWRIHREIDLRPYETAFRWSKLQELLRDLALVKLQQPLREHLYSLYSSRTQFEVYQFKPVLKFLANPDQRLLIADEVGLGKTIEAGIIYLELQARLNINRVLVVCPSGLRLKWQDEMRQRFDEEFIILDAEGIRRFVHQYNLYGENTRLRGIVSLEMLRRKEFINHFQESRLNFDLVIIDEAHHCRNSSTKAYDLATTLSDNADAMLLLTGTPLQIGNQDLFNLLHILNPGEFDDSLSFFFQLEPNQHVNRAAQILATGNHKAALIELRNVEGTQERSRFHANPYYQEVVRLLAKDYLRREEMIQAQRRIVELNTLAQIFTRTRKREIAEKVPVRAAFTLDVEFTPVEARFYDLVIEYAREEFRRLHGTNYAVGWVTVMRERQTASCIAAARERFEELAEEAAQDVMEEGFFDPNVLDEEDEDEAADGSYARLRPFRFLLPKKSELEVDSKFNIFWDTLKKVLQEDDSSKVIVFSFFVSTVEHIYKQLHRRGVKVLYLHGKIKVQDRLAVIDEFRSNPEQRVLVSSDVGAEGLDFQFCNTIFNYDLPWNPMRLEQRIGRIDRFGQESPRIRIYNMAISNSIESRILMRLYERIGLFQAALGDIEAILGEEIRELTRKVYTRHLTPQEEILLADQTANSIIRRQQELEEFEKNRLQFMGQEAIFSTLVNQTIESGNYLSHTEIHGLVETFISDKFDRSRIECNYPEDDTYCLWLNDDLAEYLRGYILNTKKSDLTAQTFLKALTPGKQLPITFKDQMASRRKLLHFITIRHPLAQAALEYWKKKINPAETFARIGIEVGEDSGFTIRTGDHYFFLFTFFATGIEQISRLVPVVIEPQEGDIYIDLSRRLLHLLQTASSDLVGSLPAIDPADLEKAQQSAMDYMITQRDALEAEVKQSNDALVNARLSAITQSYEAKRRRIQRTLEKVKETRIRRMYEGQLRNQAATFEARRKEIEAQRDVSASFNLALRGLVRVSSAINTK